MSEGNNIPKPENNDDIFHDMADAGILPRDPGGDRARKALEALAQPESIPEPPEGPAAQTPDPSHDAPGVLSDAGSEGETSATVVKTLPTNAVPPGARDALFVSTTPVSLEVAPVGPTAIEISEEEKKQLREKFQEILRSITNDEQEKAFREQLSEQEKILFDACMRVDVFTFSRSNDDLELLKNIIAKGSVFQQRYPAGEPSPVEAETTSGPTEEQQHAQDFLIRIRGEANLGDRLVGLYSLNDFGRHCFMLIDTSGILANNRDTAGALTPEQVKAIQFFEENLSTIDQRILSWTGSGVAAEPSAASVSAPAPEAPANEGPSVGPSFEHSVTETPPAARTEGATPAVDVPPITPEPAAAEEQPASAETIDPVRRQQAFDAMIRLINDRTISGLLDALKQTDTALYEAVRAVWNHLVWLGKKRSPEALTPENVQTIEAFTTWLENRPAPAADRAEPEAAEIITAWDRANAARIMNVIRTNYQSNRSRHQQALVQLSEEEQRVIEYVVQVADVDIPAYLDNRFTLNDLKALTDFEEIYNSLPSPSGSRPSVLSEPRTGLDYDYRVPRRSGPVAGYPIPPLDYPVPRRADDSTPGGPSRLPRVNPDNVPRTWEPVPADRGYASVPPRPRLPVSNPVDDPLNPPPPYRRSFTPDLTGSRAAWPPIVRRPDGPLYPRLPMPLDHADVEEPPPIVPPSTSGGATGGAAPRSSNPSGGSRFKKLGAFGSILAGIGFGAAALMGKDNNVAANQQPKPEINPGPQINRTVVPKAPNEVTPGQKPVTQADLERIEAENKDRSVTPADLKRIEDENKDRTVGTGESITETQLDDLRQPLPSAEAFRDKLVVKYTVKPGDTYSDLLAKRYGWHNPDGSWNTNAIYRQLRDDLEKDSELRQDNNRLWQAIQAEEAAQGGKRIDSARLQQLENDIQGGKTLIFPGKSYNSFDDLS